jgi:hypothetical protein
MSEGGAVRSAIERVKLPLALILAEEVAREVAQAIRPPPRLKMVTRTLDLSRKLVRGFEELISSRREGKLRELMIRSLSKDFRVAMLVDGVRLMDRSFDELVEVSQYLESVDAFEAEGEYILRLKDISWTRDFLLALLTKGDILFPRIVGFWDEALEG